MSSEPEVIPEDELSPNDWQLIADWIHQEFDRRQRERRHIELQWDQVDRQVRMENVTLPDDPSWWPETELPLQSETLELLTADARRLLFPADRGFFSAVAALEEGDLQNLDWDGFVGPGVTPVQEAIKSRGPQAFANELVTAMLSKYHNRYRLRDAVDGINTEAFKYGEFIAECRTINSESFTMDYRGETKGRYPALVAHSMREHYLDDSPTRLFKDGLEVSPGIIRQNFMDLNDIRLAAAGSTDPIDSFGGWKPDNLDGLEGSLSTHPSNNVSSSGVHHRREGRTPLPPIHVEQINFSGDLVVPRGSGRAIYLPNVQVTMATENGRVIRYRENEFPFNTYITGTYHDDFVGSVHSSSPLMKGASIAAAATRAMKEMMAVAALNAGPIIKYDHYDQTYTATGGPVVHPRAMWSALTNPEVIEIGSLSEAREVYLLLLQQYQDQTGITAPRLGQQTKSHQTAFAVDTEVTRGMVRTVDYVRSVMHGALQSFLHMEYEMAKSLDDEELVNIPNFDGFIRASGQNLPQIVEFDITGAGTPLEERERKAAEVGAIQTLIQIEPIARQLGSRKPLDIDEARNQIARAGGITDTSALFPDSAPAGATPGIEAAPGIPGTGEGTGAPAA